MLQMKNIYFTHFLEHYRTFTLDGRFEYLSKNCVITCGNIGCDYNQIEIHPKKLLSKYGGLSKQGRKWINMLTN